MSEQKPSKRLQVVLKLARLREQRAAEELAQAIKKQTAQQQQQRQLQEYVRDYSDRSALLGERELQAAQLSNFQQFYAQLDSALDTQRQQLCLLEQQTESARQQWQQQYLRQKNLDALIEKKRLLEERALENKLQREQDDRPLRKMNSD